MVLPLLPSNRRARRGLVVLLPAAALFVCTAAADPQKFPRALQTAPAGGGCWRGDRQRRRSSRPPERRRLAGGFVDASAGAWRRRRRTHPDPSVSGGGGVEGAVALAVAGSADRRGRTAERNGFELPSPPDASAAVLDGAAVFDGRKSPFGSAALGKRRLPPVVAAPMEDEPPDDDSSLPPPPPSPTAAPTSPDAATADLILRRDRALLALQQHLGLSTAASLDVLTRFPDLYDSVKCPSLSSKLLYLLNVVNLPKKRLCHMMLKHPTLTARVVLDSEANLVSTIEVLQTELGLTSADILAVSSGRLPAVLGYDRSELRRRIRTYRHDLGYPPDVLKRMVLRDPEILRTNGAWVRRSAEVLREELGMDLEDVHRMVRRARLVLTYDPEGNVRPTVRFLKAGTAGRCLGLVRRGGISVPAAGTDEERERIVRERVREFVLKFPNVLALSVENNLAPTLNFFLAEVGVPELGLGKMLTRRPTLLELKVDMMRGKLRFLADELGVDRPQLAEMAVRFPDLFALSIAENLRPKIEYLRGDLGLGLGMNSTQIRRVLHSKPQILSLNLERNLVPKVEYLTRPASEGGAGLSLGEVRDWWASYPQTVMCSLDTLIRPRMETVQQAGLNFRPSDPDRSDVPINFVWKPKRSWEEWVRANVSGRTPPTQGEDNGEDDGEDDGADDARIGRSRGGRRAVGKMASGEKDNEAGGR